MIYYIISNIVGIRILAIRKDIKELKKIKEYFEIASFFSEYFIMILPFEHFLISRLNTQIISIV